MFTVLDSYLDSYLDNYTIDLIDMEAMEEASQDYLRIPAAGDMTSRWSRSFPVQYQAQGL